MSSPGSIVELIVGLFWPPNPIPQAAILILLGFAVVVATLVYGPLLLRLLQIGSLRRSVQACFDEEGSNAIQRQEVGNAFSESPLAYQWSDFVRRWQNAIAADPIQNASLPELSRAPVRLMDVLEEHPVIPAGSRRSLLPALPAIFLSAGLLGAFAGIVLALPGIGLSLDPPAFEATSRSQQVTTLMEHLGMALRIGLWGLLLSLAAAVTGRFIEGRSDALAESLDGWVQLAYGAISTGELATRTAHEHRAAISRLQADVGELLRQVSGRPRPLVRSGSAAPGAAAGSAASPLDPASLESSLAAVSESLAERLSARLDRTVAEQLAALRESLSGAIEGLGTRAAGAPAELGQAVEHLARVSESQDAASRSLTQTAHTVSDAAGELRAGLDDFADVVTKMRETSEALRLAAGRVDSGHAGSARAAERLGSALDRVEQDASVRQQRVDDHFEALRGAIDRLADQLEDRRAPAADEASDELQAATPDSAEPEGSEAKPSEQGAPPEERTASLEDGPEQAAAAGSAAREVPSEGSERSAASSPPRSPEADTVPYMKAPTPEMIYAARASEDVLPDAGRPATAPTPAATRNSESGGGGTLSGLLRATHHSGPQSELPASSDDFDPAATLVLRPPDRDHSEAVDDIRAKPPAGEEQGDEAPDDETTSTRGSGFFGRRK